MNRSTTVCGLVDVALRHHRLADAARGLRDERHRHDRGAGELVAGLVVVDVEQRLEAPRGGEHREGGLDVDAHVAGVDRDRERLGRREAGVELVVDQQAPDVAEGDAADEVLDVDAAVAQRAAFLVRLGDLGLEGDDALEAGDEVRHARSRSSWPAARSCTPVCWVRLWAGPRRWDLRRRRTRWDPRRRAHPGKRRPGAGAEGLIPCSRAW